MHHSALKRLSVNRDFLHTVPPMENTPVPYYPTTGNHRSQRVGIATSGGNAPALNAVIHGATQELKLRGHEAVGIPRGWDGMLKRKRLIHLCDLSHEELMSLVHTGGSTLRNCRTKIGKEHYPKLKRVVAGYGLDGIIIAGGDDTLGQAARINRLHVLQPAHKRSNGNTFMFMGVPKTVDNDVDGTAKTFGFESAVQAVRKQVIDMKTDARTMCRLGVVEVMGRDAGHIALHAGYAGGADITLIPEFKLPVNEVANRVAEVLLEQEYCVICVGEAYGGVEGNEADGFGHKKKQDAGKKLIAALKEHLLNHPKLQRRKMNDVATSLQVVGYDARDGDPVATDSILGGQFGGLAAHLADREQYGRMVSLQNGEITHIALSRAKGGRVVTELEYDPVTMRMWNIPKGVVPVVLRARQKAERAMRGHTA